MHSGRGSLTRYKTELPQHTLQHLNAAFYSYMDIVHSHTYPHIQEHPHPILVISIRPATVIVSKLEREDRDTTPISKGERETSINPIPTPQGSHPPILLPQSRHLPPIHPISDLPRDTIYLSSASHSYWDSTYLPIPNGCLRGHYHSSINLSSSHSEISSHSCL